MPTLDDDDTSEALLDDDEEAESSRSLLDNKMQKRKGDKGGRKSRVKVVVELVVEVSE